MSGWLGRLLGRASPVALAARWVVVDCETSGLDPGRDRLLSIGAVATAGQRLKPGECFEVFVRQDRASSPANIAVHGIGAEAQRAGVPARAALEGFLAFCGDAPLAAFHADFDRAVLERAARECGLRLRARWLDLARLLPVLYPGPPGERRTLDDWIARFAITHPARHDALADAYVSAQLLQIALAEAARQGFRTTEEVLRSGTAARWVHA